MALEKELQTYEKSLPSLIGDAGKFVVIHDDTILGVFFAYEDALKAGYSKWGLGSFLVKKIEATEQIHFFSRELCLT